MKKTTVLGNPSPQPSPQGGEGANDKGAGFDLGEHHGRGGSYVTDPEADTITLVARTQEAGAVEIKTEEKE